MLTDEQLEKLLGDDFKTAYTGHVDECHLIAETQEKQTLKEVGEWMENHKLGWRAEANGKILEITSLKDVDELYQALKRGEMLEEVKMSFQKCPVCNGVGVVSGGYFTRAGDCNSWVATSAYECCLTCEGRGIIDETTGLPPREPEE